MSCQTHDVRKTPLHSDTVREHPDQLDQAVGFVPGPLGYVRDLLIIKQHDQCSCRAVATQMLFMELSFGIVIALTKLIWANRSV